MTGFGKPVPSSGYSAGPDVEFVAKIPDGSPIPTGGEMAFGPDGDYLYQHEGTTARVFDMTDPANPLLADSVDIGDDNSAQATPAVSPSGEHVYFSGGYKVVPVNSDGTFGAVGSYSFVNDDITVTENYAVTLGGNTPVNVLDRSDPLEAGDTLDAGRMAAWNGAPNTDLRVDLRHLMIADGVIYAFARPGAPTVLAFDATALPDLVPMGVRVPSFKAQNYVFGHAVSDTHLLVRDYDGGGSHRLMKFEESLSG
ncbi:hypothetical protein [Halorubellus litoreus]|uniref:WD40-like Beta Propeller Repeat n=1 Tax=Halorubellus litoreus TaxID=755308 RepID=A0ABD5VFH2_9EURY